jgi:hypothetical protein
LIFRRIPVSQNIDFVEVFYKIHVLPVRLRYLALYHPWHKARIGLEIEQNGRKIVHAYRIDSLDIVLGSEPTGSVLAAKCVNPEKESLRFIPQAVIRGRKLPGIG